MSQILELICIQCFVVTQLLWFGIETLNHVLIKEIKHFFSML